MKNSITELENELDGTFSQCPLENGLRIVAKGLNRSLLTHCPLTAIVNTNTEVNPPFFKYKVGLAFYIPDGTVNIGITLRTTKRNPATLQVNITYDFIESNDNTLYTLYDFHTEYKSGVVQLDLMKVIIDPFVEYADGSDPQTPRGTYVVIQYSE